MVCLFFLHGFFVFVLYNNSTKQNGVIPVKKRLILFLLVFSIALLPVCSAFATYRVNTSWLKAHKEPKYSSTVVDSYRRDFAVSILRTYKGGWARVRFLPSGNTAYVQSKYLAKSKSYTAYVSKNNTAVHTGPATSFSSRGKLSKGTKVTVLSHGHAFDYVSTPKGKGYIRNTHLTGTKPAAAKAKKSASTAAHIKNPRNRTVNLRTGPGKNYKVVAEYRPGTKATILQRGSAWFKVKVGGRTGYIMRKYIAVD